MKIPVKTPERAVYRKSAKRFVFTKPALERIGAAAPGKRDYYYDTKSRGLILDVTPHGVKTFRVYRKVEGRPERLLIGRFPDVSIEQARGRAHDLNARIARGENPAHSRRAIRMEATLDWMFNEYLERHAKVEKRSWEADVWLYGKYLESWGARRLSAITRDDVEKLKSDVGTRHGRYSANRAIALLSSIFNKATAWGWLGANPTRGVPKYKEKKRERFVEAAEMPRLLAAVRNEKDLDARDAILLMLLTGARKMNVLTMRWSDLRLANATWVIPQTKSGDSLRIPLVPLAVELLSERTSMNEESVYVFVARAGLGHRVEISSAWRRIRAAAGLKDVRLHDLRRTFGSWQAAAGTSLPIIGKSLGHRNVATTAIYARLDIDPVRQAVLGATTAMLTAGAKEAVRSPKRKT